MQPKTKPELISISLPAPKDGNLNFEDIIAAAIAATSASNVRHVVDLVIRRVTR